LSLSVDHFEGWETEMMGCPTSYPATIGRWFQSILRAKYRFSGTFWPVAATRVATGTSLDTSTEIWVRQSSAGGPSA
jgi:hypothetical protein